MANRFLQLKRNAEIFQNREAATAKVTSAEFLQDKLDGELIAVRYLIDSTKPVSSTNVAIMAGNVYSKGGVKFIVLNDIQNVIETLEDGIYEYVGYEDGDDFNDKMSGTTHLKEATDVTDAILKLDKEIKDNDDAIGAEGNSSIVNYVSGNTYTSGSTNIMEAINKLDEQLESLSGSSIGEVSIDQVLKENQNYTDEDADKYNVTTTQADGTTAVTDSFQLTFTPYSPMNLTVPTTIGDIEKGTKASELNGEMLSKVLDDIIFPTVYPDVVDPSASIATASTYSSIVIAGSNAPSLKATYKRGTAKVNDGVTADKNYTGNLTGATFKYAYTAGAANTNAGVTASGTTIATGSPVTITSDIASSSITTTVGGSDVATGSTTSFKLETVGTYQFKATVNYAAGSQMQTSKGDTSNPMRYASKNGVANTTKATVANPHAASTVDTSYGVVVKATLPLSATTANTTTFTQLKLVEWGATADTTANNDTNAWTVTFPDTSKAAPVKVLSPRKLKSINAFNPTSSKYDVVLLSSFNMTTTTAEINGVTYTYYLYTWNGAVTASGKYKITWY